MDMLPSVWPGVCIRCIRAVPSSSVSPSRAGVSIPVRSGVAIPSHCACVSSRSSHIVSCSFMCTGAPVSFFSFAAPPT